ncbi:hypothetical protein Scep_030457 [Stephania cephalantha]|uniref:Xylanase inhibitor C-terminal domain-containing protein n=1 Tax=Stephania cephalantha TaxID=152367 RepID=A0AAP0HGX3_9MAGN
MSPPLIALRNATPPNAHSFVQSCGTCFDACAMFAAMYNLIRTLAQGSRPRGSGSSTRGVEFKDKNEDCTGDETLEEGLGMYKSHFGFEMLGRIKTNVWRSVVKACVLLGDGDRDKATCTKISVDGRRRMSPPCRDDFVGNVVLWAYPESWNQWVKWGIFGVIYLRPHDTEEVGEGEEDEEEDEEGSWKSKCGWCFCNSTSKIPMSKSICHCRLLDMTKKRLVDCVLTNTDEDLQSFDSDETQPPSEDQRNDNETQDEVENDLYDDVECLQSTDGYSPNRYVNVPRFLFTCGSTSLLENLTSGAVGIAGLGRIDDVSKSLMYTPFITNPVSSITGPAGEPSYEYFIGVKSIRVNEKVVPLNATLLSINKKSGQGGTKISTVVPYTVMHATIYKAFTKAFINAAKAMKLGFSSSLRFRQTTCSNFNFTSKAYEL